jgi:hypothetical protein
VFLEAKEQQQQDIGIIAIKGFLCNNIIIN